MIQVPLLLLLASSDAAPLSPQPQPAKALHLSQKLEVPFLDHLRAQLPIFVQVDLIELRAAEIKGVKTFNYAVKLTAREDLYHQLGTENLLPLLKATGRLKHEDRFALWYCLKTCYCHLLLKKGESQVIYGQGSMKGEELETDFSWGGIYLREQVADRLYSESLVDLYNQSIENLIAEEARQAEKARQVHAEWESALAALKPGAKLHGLLKSNAGVQMLSLEITALSPEGIISGQLVSGKMKVPVLLSRDRDALCGGIDLMIQVTGNDETLQKFAFGTKLRLFRSEGTWRLYTTSNFDDVRLSSP
ncbi:MAG: hypothetical protein RL095_3632 [Verrucomicrobiota bacterium]